TSRGAGVTGKRWSCLLQVARRRMFAALALLVGTPRSAGADPNKANCKPNRATCTANQQCCSGACTAGLCAAPTTTTSSSTTTTTASNYWSSTTFATGPDFAWVVEFDTGIVNNGGKANNNFVRAVRGGS